MAKFKLGDKVTYVENNQSGIVTQVYDLERGLQYYEVTWIGSGNSDDFLESRLEPVRKMDNPFELVESGIYRPFTEFHCLNTRYKIENTSVNTISSLKASRTIFKPYQYKPLLKFLNSESRRILIADEVGLGKTIEAGHIMLELKARNELSSAIIICPKSLVEKWEDELRFRFGFDFKIYEEKKEFISDIEHHRPIFGIITYEKARKGGSNDIGAALENEEVNIDLLVCDEAHKLRNDNTITHKGVNRIISTAKSAVFMTATPIMLNESNLFHLLELLDPFKFKNETVFKNLQTLNKPFVNAVSQLNAKVPFPQIAKELQEAKVRYEYKQNGGYQLDLFSVTIKDEYKDIPLFAKIINDLETLEENDANRVQIQHDITSISVLSNIFSRTTKRDVTTDWTQAVRRPETITIELSKAEKKIYDDYMFINCNGKNALAQSTHKKMLASSVIAIAEQWEYMTVLPEDTKFNKLLEILEKSVFNQDKKVIIFATQLRTLAYLAHRLRLEGITSRTISGEVKNRHIVIQEFRDNPDINVLLSSEVGGEGLDLQFCDTLINYDLPWNPMVVEQRIGRIDRFGQQSQAINIYNLLVKGTIAEKIYNRLLDRIGIFKESIGDIEVILDRFLEKRNYKKEFDEFITEELSNDELSEEEMNQKLESISKALEQEKKDVETLTAGLTDTLTNDMYFKEEIRKINNQSKYVTEHELINFVQSIIDCELKTCRLKDCGNSKWEFVTQKADSHILANFLTKYKPLKAEKNYNAYINSVQEGNRFEMTFKQEYAFEHKECEYINLYHPLIQSIKEYYKQNSQETTNTYKMEVSRDYVPEGITSNKYLLGIYLLDIERQIFKSHKHSPLLVPVLYDCDKNQFVDTNEAADKLFAAIQEHSTAFSGFIGVERSKSLQLQFSDRIAEIQDKYLADYRLRADSSKILLMQRTEAQYKREIQRLEALIDELRYSMDPNKQKMANVNEGKIAPLKQKMKDELDSLRESTVTANPYKLISLSVINIS